MESHEQKRIYQNEYEQRPSAKILRKKYRQSKEGRAARKRYRTSAKGKTSRQRESANYYPKIRDGIKRRARSKVAQAVKTGKLQKHPCIKCGDVETQAHHPDYSQPLEVVWLCQECHRQEHAHE